MNLGKYKIWADRSGGYLSMINFLILLSLKDSAAEIGLWIVGAACLLLFIMTIDMKIIFPQSQEYSAQKNPFLIEMMERLKRIEEKLND